MIQHHGDALFQQLDELAVAVGRARRRDPDNYVLVHIADRVATIDMLLQPTAADLVRYGIDLDRALDMVARHARRFETLLGEKVAA